MRLDKKQVLNYSRTNKAIRKAASAALMAYIAGIETLDGYIDVDDALAQAETIVNEYGGVAAENAASFFNELTGDVVSPVTFALDRDWLESALKYYIFNRSVSSLNALTGAVERQVKASGHETMIEAARKTGHLFARVPVGKTCAFCYMLASRGFVYHSKTTAGFGRINEFHADCDCEIVAGADEVEGYDPDKYLRGYQKAYGMAKTEQESELNEIDKLFNEEKKKDGWTEPSEELREFAKKYGVEFYQKNKDKDTNHWRTRYIRHGRRSIDFYIDENGYTHKAYSVHDYVTRKTLAHMREMLDLD